MSQQLQFLDIIFLGIIVLLLVNRLRSVLGTKSTPNNMSKTEAKKAPSKVVDISDYRTVDSQKNLSQQEKLNNLNLGNDFVMTGNMNENSVLLKNLEEIKTKFQTFNLLDFMKKAPIAFEFIAKAFADGDKKALLPLLNSSIYKNFEQAIDERNERNETAEFSLIRFKSIELESAELMGSLVDLTVQFVTEQTNIVKNEEGQVILGDATYIETITDVWTLRKDMNAKSPNWLLTATHSKVFV